MNKNEIYLASQYIKNIVLVYGKDIEIFSSFDINGHFISFDNKYNNCKDEIVYKSNIESLYLWLRLEIYSELDMLLLMVLEKRHLYNISIYEMSEMLMSI